MKAIVYTEYGTPDVLQYKEVEKPSPKDGEVLIKIHAAALNAADWYLLEGKPFIARLEAGIQKPKYPIRGADIAGQIVAVGKNVRQFQVDDAVFGDISGCGWGGLAEYVAVPEHLLALKPSNITFQQAAAVPMAAVTALQGLRKGEIKAGQKVLINGASGGVGTFAVQIAKAFGAEVTAVCSTRNVDMVRSIGADHVIDYTKENFTQNGQRYDLILAVNGFHSLSDYKRALSDEGIYVCAGGSMRQIFQAMLLGSVVSMNGRKQLRSMGTAKPNQADLQFIGDLLKDGKVVPVIDKCYPLSEAAEAFRYMKAVHAKGKVIINVEQ